MTTSRGGILNTMVEFVKRYKAELFAIYIIGFMIGIDIGMMIERSIMLRICT